MKKVIILTISLIIVYMIISYIDRGYFAIGAEIFFLPIALIIYKSLQEIKKGGRQWMRLSLQRKI